MESGSSAGDKRAAAPDADLFSGAMPKAEIGALRFLRDNPSYDGRGVLVAIFDTGVDPGAKGLQTTTDGKPKILDVLDCSGSGDVDTSTEVHATDGAVVGVFGERLALNSSWTNPSGKWRVGSKRLYQLIPRGLKSRLERERKKRFQAQQREAVTAATAALAAWQRRHEGAGGGTLTAAQEKEGKDLKDRLQTLKDLEEKREDLGPMLSCVVWHDGEHWRAALDTSDMYEPDSGKGLLADFEPLTNFRAERKFGTFSAEDACNFVLNIYDEGAVLSIVVDAGSHGTHVAGITAAHHPDDPGLNGVAPGAQIISCKIGDSRLGSMETMTGLTRALVAALDHKVDLINMSYGEATSTPNQGRFTQLASEVVNKHGIIYVSSAGNAGPALSTVGAPGGTTSACISIAAYVSPDMALGSHAIRSSLEQGQQYTWSSRGPTYDGAVGVTLAAPGGAIAPVPQWTQQSRMLMNGTSMASPSACGGVALVLSGLKAAEQAITPNRVRRALENTCKPLGDGADAALTYGRGLMQVDEAFEYLTQMQDADQPDVRYEVSVTRGDTQAQGRGVYLREPADSARPVRFTAKVEATFHEDADTRTERLALENKLRLESTQPWATAPRALMLAGGARTFEVEVDPTALPEGLHYAEVYGTDTAAPQRGALFRIPITVVKPLTVEAASKDGTQGNGDAEAQNDYIARLGWQSLVPGAEVRRFVAVPEGATWAELRLRAGSYDANRTFLIRMTQLVPQARFSEFEKTATVSLSGTGTFATVCKVAAGGTLEVTLSQFWSSVGDSSLEAELEFHGLCAEPGTVALDGSAGNAKLWVRAPFRPEKLTPAAKLDRLRIAVRPAEAALSPLPGSRDALPDGRTAHGLVLTYKFGLLEDGKVTPLLPMLNRYVYDGELEQQMYMLFDANKKLLATGDIYPAAVQLAKGEYTLRLLLRHDSAPLLDKFRALPLIIEKQVEGVTVPVYPGNSASILAAKDGPVKDRRLAAGQRTALFVGPAPEDKLPKDATAGRLLTGTLNLAKLAGAAGSGDAPGAPTFSYLVPPKKQEEKKPTVKEDPEEGDEKPTPEQRLSDVVRDAKIAALKDLDDGEAYAALQAELLADGGRQLPVLTERLQRAAKAHAKPDADHSAFNADVEAAEAVEAAVDANALAVFLAQKTPEEVPGAEKRKKEFDEQKSALVEALAFKLRVLLDAEDAAAPGALRAEQAEAAAPAPAAADASPSADQAEGSPVSDAAPAEAAPVAKPVPAPAEDGGAPAGTAGPAASQIEEAYRALRKWVDTAEDGKHALLHARCEARVGRLAAALRALDKATTAAMEDKDGQTAKMCAERRVAYFRALGWPHWARQEESRIRNAFPPSYPLF